MMSTKSTFFDSALLALRRRRLGKRSWIFPVLALTACGIAPLVGLNPYWTIQVQQMAILALIVSGLNLSYGFAGELALGQVAIYALGAYLTAYMSLHGVNDLLLTLLASGLAAALVGVISGIPGMRLGGWALAMVSFFLILLVPDIVLSLSSITGGYNGLAGIPQPELFGFTLTTHQLFWATLSVLLAWLLFMRNLIESRHGAALRMLKASPVLAGTLGVPVYRLKVMAYGLGAIPAGFAGALFAYQQQFVSPDAFTFTASVGVIAGSVIGGVDSIYGALAGGALLVVGPEQASNFSQYSSIVYGAVLIVGGIVFSGGIAGIGRKLMTRLGARIDARLASVSGGGSRVDLPAPAFAEVVVGDVRVPAKVGKWVGGEGTTLRVEDVSRRFGGVLALDGVSLEALPGRITALIGPNGSGKTTMLNGISGLVRFDSGSVALGERDITRARPHEIATFGVSRTFQTPAIPQSLPVWEVVAGSRYTRPRSGIVSTALRLPRYTKISSEDRDVALAALECVGIPQVFDKPATSLPLGTQRLVEVARALAARPSLILLDEPASGLETGEIEQLAEVLRQLGANGESVVVVEHNFRFVLRLADDIYVLDHGRVLATGSPAEIAANEQVISTYLGRSSLRASISKESDSVLNSESPL